NLAGRPAETVCLAGNDAGGGEVEKLGFRVIPGFENYAVNRQGTVKRIRRGSIKNTAPLGKPLRGRGLDRAYMLGKYGPQKTARSLIALAFGPEAVQPWRYHIVTHPEVKLRLPGESNPNHK